MMKCVFNRVLKRHVFAIITSLVKKGEGGKHQKPMCHISSWMTNIISGVARKSRSEQAKKKEQ